MFDDHRIASLQWRQSPANQDTLRVARSFAEITSPGPTQETLGSSQDRSEAVWFGGLRMNQKDTTLLLHFIDEI